MTFNRKLDIYLIEEGFEFKNVYEKIGYEKIRLDFLQFMLVNLIFSKFLLCQKIQKSNTITIKDKFVIKYNYDT